MIKNFFVKLKKNSKTNNFFHLFAKKVRFSRFSDETIKWKANKETEIVIKITLNCPVCNFQQRKGDFWWCPNNSPESSKYSLLKHCIYWQKYTRTENSLNIHQNQAKTSTEKEEKSSSVCNFFYKNYFFPFFLIKHNFLCTIISIESHNDVCKKYCGREGKNNSVECRWQNTF